jgi:hypothetical protein
MLKIGHTSTSRPELASRFAQGRGTRLQGRRFCRGSVGPHLRGGRYLGGSLVRLCHATPGGRLGDPPYRIRLVARARDTKAVVVPRQSFITKPQVLINSTLLPVNPQFLHELVKSWPADPEFCGGRTILPECLSRALTA